MRRLPFFIVALALPALACLGTAPQNNVPVIWVTPEVSLTPTPTPIVASITPTLDPCASLTAEECANNGTHTYSFFGKVTGAICFYEGVTSASRKEQKLTGEIATIHFSEESMSITGVYPDATMTFTFNKSGQNTYTLTNQPYLNLLEDAVIIFSNSGFTETRVDHFTNHPDCEWQEISTLSH